MSSMRSATSAAHRVPSPPAQARGLLERHSMLGAVVPDRQHCHRPKDRWLIPLIPALGGSPSDSPRVYSAAPGAAVPSALPYDRRVRNASLSQTHATPWLETALFTAMAVNPHPP